MNSDFFKIDRFAQFTAWAILIMAFVVCYDQWFYWENQEDYSFGFLVPFFVGYVLYDRWPLIKSYLLGTKEDLVTVEKPGLALNGLALLVILGTIASLIVFMLGGMVLASQGRSNLGSGLIVAGFAGTFLGLAFFAGEKDVKGRIFSLKDRLTFSFLFLFPALVWFISAPMVMFFDSTVKLILLEKVTVIVDWVFTFLGYNLIREGNILILPDQSTVGVADACSGVRSLTACIFAGTFLSAVFLDRFWKKVLLVSMAMVLAFCTNILRSLFLTAWAYAHGAEAIEGNVHDITGYAVLGITSILLIAMLPLFNFKIAPPDDDDDHEDGSLPVNEKEPQHT